MRTQDEFIAELKSWEGTPYAHGVSIRGQGVDCVRFVVSMLEWMHGREATAECIPFNFPAQAAYCEVFPAKQLIGWMTERYGGEFIYRNSRKDAALPPIMPADVLVLEHTDDAPCHMMLGGVDGTVWHANNAGGGCGTVCWTGLTDTMLDSMWCVWRVKGVEILK